MSRQTLSLVEFCERQDRRHSKEVLIEHEGRWIEPRASVVSSLSRKWASWDTWFQQVFILCRRILEMQPACLPEPH